jgi:hypothetical protein
VVFASSKPHLIAPLVQSINTSREQRDKDKEYKHDNNDTTKKKKNNNKNKHNNAETNKGQKQVKKQTEVNRNASAQYIKKNVQGEQSNFIMDAKEFLPTNFSNGQTNYM